MNDMRKLIDAVESASPSFKDKVGAFEQAFDNFYAHVAEYDMAAAKDLLDAMNDVWWVVDKLEKEGFDQL
jgi:hypothetical protein